MHQQQGYSISHKLAVAVGDIVAGVTVAIAVVVVIITI